MGAAVGPEPHQRHDQQQARLGDLAAARLGRADRGVRARKRRRLRRNPAGRGRQPAHRRRLRKGRRRRLVHGRRARALPRLARQRGMEEDRRHLRRLVRFRLDPCVRAGRPRALSGPRRHQAQGRWRPRHRDVSGRLGPASRLVPVVAAGKLRHPRPRAVRRGADPWLHARRERPQDVEIGRQHRRAAKGDEGFRRRYPAALGLRHRLCRRPAHRPGNPQEHHRDLSQAAQLDPLDARHAASFQAGAMRSRLPRCPSWSG